MVASSLDPELPDIDERLVAPETPYEILDGEVIYVPPCDPPHGTRHADVLAVMSAHASPEFRIACDMLTRTSRLDDFAPDVSVFPRAPDPRTGGRQLEHLAFEIVSTQTIAHAGRKAEKLVGRGVRRVFAINVERDRVLEWSRELGTWQMLDRHDVLVDRALAVDLPVAALLDAAPIDDAVARALVARNNQVLEEARSRDRAEARSRDRAEAILEVLAARGVAICEGERARVLDEPDRARLTRWLARAATCASAAELFAEP